MTQDYEYLGPVGWDLWVPTGTAAKVGLVAIDLAVNSQVLLTALLKAKLVIPRSHYQPPGLRGLSDLKADAQKENGDAYD